MSNHYIYAVARIRSLEMSLFTQSVLEQLIGTKSYAEALQFLVERGWGAPETDLQDGEAILEAETKKTWSLIEEMVDDMSEFSVLTLQDAFHDLKAAIKSVVVGEPPANVFFGNFELSGQDMMNIIKEKDYTALPEYMRQCAKEAYDSLIHTKDGQLCDIIIDQATMKAILDQGKKAKDPVFSQYAETKVAVANIKIAIRCAKTGKTMEFMNRAMTPCETIQVEKLAKAALGGVNEIMNYLQQTPYAGAIESLTEGAFAFERWCDNKMIETMQPQKYNSFTVGALVAYILARTYEIKTVRIILTSKQNGLPDTFIRERIRKTYV